MAGKSTRRILWAVDAFAEDKELHKKTAKLLKAWTKGENVAIEPVFILGPDQIRVSLDMFAELVPDLRVTAKERLQGMMKTVKMPGLLEPTFLSSSSISLRGAVHELLLYARQIGAELIVAGTNSKKGATRFLFGSFAETLVLQSEIPVFIVGPKAQAVSTFKHILFPSDGTDKAREALEKVLPLVKEHNAKLTIFHKVEYINEFTVGTLESTPIYTKLMEDDLKRRRKNGEALLALAKKNGVDADFVMGTKMVTSVAEAVLKAAKRAGADMIAMASQTGPFATAILGSCARQVLRSSQCAVWIIHPQKNAPEAISPNSFKLEAKGAVNQ